MDDQRAIDLAANFIGESIIFSVAVLVVTIEAYRKRIEDREKHEQAAQTQAALELRIAKIEEQMQEMQSALTAIKSTAPSKSWLPIFTVSDSKTVPAPVKGDDPAVKQ